MLPLAYCHVDVFSPFPFGGNSLAVFPDASGLSTAQMRDVTRELRHFESIFVFPDAGGSSAGTAQGDAPTARRVRARVFDLVGELDFAGHPLLGAASVLHARLDDTTNSSQLRRWTFELNSKTVHVDTELLSAAHGEQTRERQTWAYRAVLDQGRPEFLGGVAAERAPELAEALGLTSDDLHPSLPLEVVSTGLRYLIVPLAGALSRAHIARPDFETLLATIGAEFAYLVDVSDLSRPEGRHWNNDGVIEDVATGSGAGCAAAYLARHGAIAVGHDIVLHQGRFTGRPSELRIRAEGSPDDITRVLVGGDVALVGHGNLETLPSRR